MYATNWPRRVEDASLHPLLLVVLLQEQLVEVDDRILLGFRSPKSQHHRFHVGAIKQVGDFARRLAHRNRCQARPPCFGADPHGGMFASAPAETDW